MFFFTVFYFFFTKSKQKLKLKTVKIKIKQETKNKNIKIKTETKKIEKKKRRRIKLRHFIQFVVVFMGFWQNDKLDVGSTGFGATFIALSSSVWVKIFYRNYW